MNRDLKVSIGERAVVRTMTQKELKRELERRELKSDE
jgi:hypothetical protein